MEFVTFNFTHTFFTGHGFDIISNFKALAFVLLSQVTLVEAVMVLDVHVDRVVEEAFTVRVKREWGSTFGLRGGAF